MALLELRGISKRFGGLSAIDRLDLDVHRGEIVGLIGPNGAGKTTTFSVISGFQRPNQGSIKFDGNDITGLAPDKIARRGLVRSFQSTKLFGEKTVLQNMLISHHLQYKAGVLSALLDTRGYRREQADVEHKSLEALEFFGLAQVKGELAGNLPHGLQRRLGMAIARCANPQLVLLDEPLTGMSHDETFAMVHIIRMMRDTGLTVLVVEHNVRAVMQLCDRIAVLNFGQKIADGTPAEIRDDRRVIGAYLGT